MSRPKNTLVKKRKLLMDVRSKKKIGKTKHAKKFTRHSKGTALRVLYLLPDTVYMPNFKKMKEMPYFIDLKAKLPPSLLYFHMHSKKHTFIKEEMNLGIRLHKSFSDWLKLEKEAIVDFPTGISSSEYYWISLKPDGLFPTKDGLILIELKTISSSDFDEYTKIVNNQHSIPLKITYQIQSYMNILNVKNCLLAFYCYENGRSKIIEVQRDEGFKNVLKKSFRVFVRLLFKKEGVKVKSIPKEVYKIQQVQKKNEMKDIKGKKSKEQVAEIMETIFRKMTESHNIKESIEKIKYDKKLRDEQEDSQNEKLKKEKEVNHKKRKEFFTKRYGRREKC